MIKYEDRYVTYRSDKLKRGVPMWSVMLHIDGLGEFLSFYNKGAPKGLTKEAFFKKLDFFFDYAKPFNNAAETMFENFVKKEGWQ